MAVPASFTFPTVAELSFVEAERQLGFDEVAVGSRIMPITTVDSDVVMWEIEGDVIGLMPVRQENQPFPTAQEPGIKRYAMIPAQFGEFRQIDEVRLRSQRMMGTWGQPYTVDEHIAHMQRQLAIRMRNTMEYIRWTIWAAGSVTVPNQNYANSGLASDLVEVARLDGWSTTAPAVPFTTYATSVPLQFFAAQVSAWAGFGSKFDSTSQMYMNFATAQMILNNTNTSDLFGHRAKIGATVNDLTMLNDMFVGRGLPQIVIVDDNYRDSNNAVQRFIPDGYIVHVGNHETRGLVVGEFQMTRNGAMNGTPGLYAEAGQLPTPPRLPWTARGFNGGPMVRYPNQVKVYKVN